MHALGKSNWRIPRALDRILPRLDLEDGSEAAGLGDRNRLDDGGAGGGV
jgi:hypothetical protein